MLIKLICSPLIILVNGIIDMLPSSVFNTENVNSLLHMIDVGLNFFPADVWVLILGAVVFWFTVHFAVGIYMFIKGLIPIIG